jgi:hypothetical protein
MQKLMDESNHNANSNGHGIFGLVAKTDPDILAVLEMRRRARADGRLNRSMKACLDEVADRACNPAFFDVRGIVTISDRVLAEIFEVSLRSIFTWKKQIEACGYWWLNRKFKSNMWPITTYNLTVLHKPMSVQKTDDDGTYGTSRFRPLAPTSALGCRRPGQPVLPLPGSRPAPPVPKIEEMQGISGQTGEIIRARPEDNCGSHPKAISGQTRKILRGTPETNFGSDPKPVAGLARKSLPVSPEAACEHIKDKVQGKDSLKGGSNTPAPENELKEWENSLKGMFPHKLRKMEADLNNELKKARTAKARATWARRIAIVRTKLLGGPVEDKPEIIVRPLKPKAIVPEIPFADRIRLFKEARKQAGI